MKGKLWNPKNSYAAKTQIDKQNNGSKDSLLLGQKVTLYSHFGRQQHSTITHSESALNSKESKFQQLKKQIQCLENSQFLSLKYRCHTEPDVVEESIPRSTGKEFMPSKKVTQLQKFKMHLRRKGKTRRISLLLDKNKPEENKQCTILNFLEVKDLNRNTKDCSLKKKETPSIVKKYYRPQTGVPNRSMSHLNIRSNQVRGRSLKSSATNRMQKQNILIYCF